MGAAPQSWTQTVDTMFTTTWAKRKPKAVEQAFLKTPLIYWMRKKDRIENQAGYTRIEIPLEYGSNDTVRWFSKGDTVPIKQPDIMTMAYEDWKYVSVSLVRNFEDDQKNRSDAALIRYSDAQIGAAERALNEEFERVFFSDGSGAKEPNGFQNIISSAPTTGTLHGINRATAANSYFRNQQKTATGSSSLYLIKDMRTCLNNTLKYSNTELKDILIVTTQDIYEYYEEECYELKVLQNTMLAEAGFDTLQFRGRPFLWAPSAPSGNMYFVNTAYLKLVSDEAFWMDMTEWKPIPDQPNDRVAQIVSVCNLVSSRPICHNVLTAITA